MGLQCTRESLLHNVRPDIEIFQSRISLPGGEHEAILFYQVGLLLFLGLSGLVKLLDVLDHSECCLKIHTWRCQLTRLLDISGSVGNFFDESCLRILEPRLILSYGGTGMEKVNSEVRIVPLNATGDVLDGGDVERNGNTKDREDDCLILLIKRFR